jgi:opacity protein-like surface antigen
MRKHIIALFIILCTGFLPVFSQIEAGTKLAGLQGFLSMETSGKGNAKSTSSQISLLPSYGVFITNQIAIGGEVIFERESTKGSYSLTNYGLGAFARYYYPISQRFSAYGVLKPTYVINSDKSIEYDWDGKKIGDDTEKTNNFQINAGVGAAFFLKENVSLDFNYLIGKNFGKTKYESTTYKDSWNVGQFLFGLQFYLK